MLSIFSWWRHLLDPPPPLVLLEFCSAPVSVWTGEPGGRRTYMHCAINHNVCLLMLTLSCTSFLLILRWDRNHGTRFIFLWQPGEAAGFEWGEGMRLTLVWPKLGLNWYPEHNLTTIGLSWYLLYLTVVRVALRSRPELIFIEWSRSRNFNAVLALSHKKWTKCLILKGTVAREKLFNWGLGVMD